MTNDSLENQILTRYKKGISRRDISRALGITEWKVRTTVRSAMTNAVSSRKKGQKGTGSIKIANVRQSKEKTIKAVILSDIHIPYHDPKSLAIVLEYMKDYQPDHIILNGDILDCYNASSYRKDPTRIHTLQDEINETRDFLVLLRKQHPTADIDYTMGNHETRLERLILDKASDLGTLSCLALDELLGLEELNIRFVDEKQQVNLGNLEVFHGTIVRRDSGASAKAHHTKTGGSVLIGHVHRLGQFYKTNRWGTHVCLENGFLGRMDFDYADRPDWQQGFTTVEYMLDGRFSARQHFIDNHSLIVDGKIYSA